MFDESRGTIKGFLSLTGLFVIVFIWSWWTWFFLFSVFAEALFWGANGVFYTGFFDLSFWVARIAFVLGFFFSIGSTFKILLELDL